MSSPTDVVIAVDPGRGKCGVAVVGSSGSVAARVVVDTAALPNSVSELSASWSPRAILVGDGTGSGDVLQALTALGLPAPLVSVDERYTTEAARARYLAETPARGWHRLVPRSLRTPDRPYDDWVAVILAERWWRAQADTPDHTEHPPGTASTSASP